MLVRTVFIESVGRYDRLFSQNPTTYFAQYAERVAMVKGRLDRKASTATGYGWAVCTMGYPQLNNCAPRASLGIFGHKKHGLITGYLRIFHKKTPHKIR